MKTPLLIFTLLFLSFPGPTFSEEVKQEGTPGDLFKKFFQLKEEIETAPQVDPRSRREFYRQLTNFIKENAQAGRTTQSPLRPEPRDTGTTQAPAPEKWLLILNQTEQQLREDYQREQTRVQTLLKMAGQSKDSKHLSVRGLPKLTWEQQLIENQIKQADQRSEQILQTLHEVTHLKLTLFLWENKPAP